MSLPLDGVRVVELATMIAGPGATHLLAQQGATVVKVEDRAVGEPLRPFGSGRGGMSTWYANANAGKRSVALDLGTDAGRDVMIELLSDADVFVQGFRPGVVERLGLGPDEVLAANPRLVYLSVSGFGPDGPYASEPVYDPVIQGYAGWAGLQTDDRGPALIKSVVSDKVTAYTAAQALTAALFERERTGRGRHLTLAMLDANVAFLWPDAMMHCSALADDAVHMPNLLAGYRTVAVADGHVVVVAATDAQAHGLCAAFDRSELAEDERFATMAVRAGHFAAWTDAIGELMAPFGREEVLRRAHAHDVPCAPVLRPDEVADDPQVRHNRTVVELDHPVIGPYLAAAPAVRFGEVDLSPAPLLGQHTDEVLAELGRTPDEVAALRAAGAVG